MDKSIEKSILSRILKHGKGWSFSAKDLTDLGSRGAIDIALHRLKAEGAIRRVMRGIYDYPRIGKITAKPISPDIWSVAQTIARKNGWKILPSGETALNALGLSTQVPGSYIFYTDGQRREYKLANQSICFRKRTPKDLQSADGSGSLVIQALKALGKDRIGNSVIKVLRRKLNQTEKHDLLKTAQYGTGWLYEVIKKICRGTKDG